MYCTSGWYFREVHVVPAVYHPAVEPMSPDLVATGNRNQTAGTFFFFFFFFLVT